MAMGEEVLDRRPGRAEVLKEPLPPRSRLLLVDDKAHDRSTVLEAVHRVGMDVHVTETKTLRDALRILAEEEFDCVLLGHRLPDGSGLDLMGACRRAGRRIPVVVLTDQGDEALSLGLLRAGALDAIPRTRLTPARLSQAILHAARLHAEHRWAREADEERGQLLLRERASREKAEAAHRRLAFLAEASTLFTSTLDLATTLENTAKLTVPILADLCFVDLAEEGGAFQRVAVGYTDPAQAGMATRMRRRYESLPEAPHGISRVLLTGRAEMMQDPPDWILVSVARDAEHLDALRKLGIKAVICVPLLARGRTLGAMTFLSTNPTRRYTLDDLAFAEQVASRAALGVDNARLYQEACDAEERLRHQLDFTRAITHSLAEGICALDAKGLFTFLNPAAQEILGIPQGQAIGRSVHTCVHEAGAHPETECPLLEPLRSETVSREDTASFVRADGTRVPVAYTASPIATSGRIVGAVVAFRDVTSRLRAETELEASRRQLGVNEKLSALGTLISGVAHEIRTPLTYLVNNLFLARARLEAASRERPDLRQTLADVDHFHRSAMEGVDRINALVKELRPFANPGAGPRTAASLHDVVAHAVDLFRATHRGRVDVQAHLAATPEVRLDPGQIQRVVINLLVNAADAMSPQGGIVSITTCPAREGGAQIEITDQGPGIPPEVEARMFDPFFTTKPDGTGLGLAITRRILESHGGTIRHTTRPGRGTTFTILLPAATPQTTPKPQPDKRNPADLAPRPPPEVLLPD